MEKPLSNLRANGEMQILGAIHGQDNLIQSIRENLALNPQVKLMLIPYNIDLAHWVSITLHFSASGKMESAEYVDSMNGDIPQEIQTVLQTIAPDCKIIKIQKLEQNDATSCGAYAIENLLLSAKNEQPLRQISSEEARSLHLKSLEKHNKKFYKNFSERQKNNISTIKTQELNPESTVLDDVFKTLTIVQTNTESLFYEKESKFGVPDLRPSIKEMFNTVCDENGQVSLSIKNAKKLEEHFPFLQTKPLSEDKKEVFWTYTENTNATKGAGAAIVAAPSVLSSVAGYCGIAEGVALAEAFNAGQAANGLLQAVGCGVKGVVAPLTIVPTVAAMGVMALAKHKNIEFSLAIQKALDLYNQYNQDGDRNKLAEAESLLKVEFCQSDNGRYNVTRAARWLETSRDQFAFAHLLLGEIMLSNSRIEYKLIYDELKASFKDAKDPDIKSMSILAIIKFIASLDKTSYMELPSSFKVQKTESLDLAIKEFNHSGRDIIQDYFKPVYKSFGFVMTKVNKSNVLQNIQQMHDFLNYKDLYLFKYMQPHGAMCEILFTFLQAACFVILKEYDIEVSRYFNFQIAIKKHEHFTENQIKAAWLAREKIDGCIEMINIFEGDENINLSEEKILVFKTIKSFRDRFFEKNKKEKVFSMLDSIGGGSLSATTKVNITSFIGIDDELKSINNFLQKAKIKGPTTNHFLLLSGPPGVGKTDIVAQLSNKNGFALNEFKSGEENDMYIGQLEKRIRDFFANAKKTNKPTCLFFDEMDAICPEYNGAIKSSYNPDAIVTLIQKEITNLKGTKCVVIGATNYLFKVKPAIKDRAGITIHFKLPNLDSRKKIINKHLEAMVLNNPSIIEKIASATCGWSPRSLIQYLNNVVNRAKDEEHFSAIPDEDFIIEFEPIIKSLKEQNKEISIEYPRLILNDADCFADLVGLDPDVKQALKDTFLCLNNPELFDDNKNNILLFGPPGTGKTSFAKAITNSNGAIFISVEAGNYIGYGSEKLLTNIFNVARDYEKAVIFIDEIDEISKPHSIARAALQTAMEGISAKSSNTLIVIGATNNKDSIATAVLSRFNNQVEVPLPSFEQRKEVFNYCINKVKKIQLDIDLSAGNIKTSCASFAQESEGFSQRDIDSLVKLAVKKVTSENIESKSNLKLSCQHVLSEIRNVRKKANAEISVKFRI